MKKLLIGADPEVFLMDAAGGLISAIDKIGGSKWEPQPLPIGDGFAVQEDNVALEYNIPASDSPQALAININKVMEHLAERVKHLGLQFSHESAAYFPEDQLVDPRAQEFGCDPDFNAWTGRVNPRPRADNATLRSCGGHVHVGAKVDDVQALIRRMDLFLGVPAQLMDAGTLRKQLYGKAGAFRPKSYGGEYRVLSNFWIWKPALCEWVYNNTQLALDAGHLPVEEDKKTILEAINKGNSEAANFLVTKYNIPVCYA